jgi:hypothetical protein
VDDRQSILGFTEAELGFFLVFLFVVLWAASAAAEQLPREPPAEPPAKSSVQTAVRADISPDSLAALQRRLAALQHEVDSLRSPIWPSCRSRGLSSGPLLTVIVVGDGLLRLNDETLTVQQLSVRTAEARTRAEDAQCRHEVRFGYQRTLSAEETETARKRIGALMLRILPGPVVE